LFVCFQVARGMNYLHEGAPISLVHRDLKSANGDLKKLLLYFFTPNRLAKNIESWSYHQSSNFTFSVYVFRILCKKRYIQLAKLAIKSSDYLVLSQLVRYKRTNKKTIKIT
jgi:hypothetical protein